MLLNPGDLKHNLDRLEEIEKASIRLVTQAIYDFRETAMEIFRVEKDLVADIGEDITREALDRLGMSRIDERLFGKIDYKRARYIFDPEYAVKQALFVDSKAEKIEGQATATLQTAQTSMIIRQIRSGHPTEEQGKLPVVLKTKNDKYLTTTIFVKYNYRIQADENELVNVVIAGVPNGMLQDIYNPDPHNTIWKAGRNAPSRGEAFRVRLDFDRLKGKMNWRVQTIPMPPQRFIWDD